MKDEELLDEYSSLERWFGDDYAIEQPGYKEERRSGRLRVEILSRMAAR